MVNVVKQLDLKTLSQEILELAARLEKQVPSNCAFLIKFYKVTANLQMLSRFIDLHLFDLTRRLMRLEEEISKKENVNLEKELTDLALVFIPENITETMQLVILKNDATLTTEQHRAFIAPFVQLIQKTLTSLLQVSIDDSHQLVEKKIESIRKKEKEKLNFNLNLN